MSPVMYTGCCAACCGKCCGKKKDSKGRVSPGVVYPTKPKATLHHIEIPRFYEVPIPNWKPKNSSTASAVSRRDVRISPGQDYYRWMDGWIKRRMNRRILGRWMDRWIKKGWRDGQIDK
ncbi:hypothetical protein KUTeg_006411 [Tegillarca granosa]|uniref:Uncharacterized protein n=1 Tax=Tegillarca granosa TaxID=220873 RepID=A0ABQ9FIL6_TEGGR|nr:hypothetical protein KUTeg_006411 [Tegillarca granosa]